MKTVRLPLITLIQLALAGSLMSQTSITLTFTANTDALHQPLDSVVVENLTQGGDTVLYYPDTVLLLDQGIGIFDPYGYHNEGLILFPSFPNPFTAQTTTRFYLPENDMVTIRVFDLPGREVAIYQQTLPAGEHTFTLYAGSERHYLLVVETSRDKRVQKLISLGGGGAFKIEHSGSNAGFSGFRKGKSGFPWAPGDQLQFTGYATLTGNVPASNTIISNSVSPVTYTFQFTESPGSGYPSGYVHCNPNNPTLIVDVTNPTTGKIWMDKNLGAFQVATSSTDTYSYGDLYQWGRFADGHQCRTSATTTTLSSTDQPGHGDFIVAHNTPFDWRSPQNDGLWQGVNGINNPCPTGYRLPTEAELNAERMSWSSNNAVGAFASPLKLPLAGYRYLSDGSLGYVGSHGYYWSSTVSGTGSSYLYFHSSSASMLNFNRALGYSVRCLKDY